MLRKAIGNFRLQRLPVLRLSSSLLSIRSDTDFAAAIFEFVKPLLQHVMLQEYDDMRADAEKEQNEVRRIMKLHLIKPLQAVPASKLNRQANYIVRRPDTPEIRFLQQLLTRRCGSAVLSGGSATGKTTAMAHVLSAPIQISAEQQAIPVACHIELRNVRTQADFEDSVRRSLGLHDSRFSSLRLRDLLAHLREAFLQLTGATKSASRICPVIWIEDIHACQPELAQDLSSGLLSFNASVIHTISEQSGFASLSQLSGYASRLEHFEFPALTEAEIVHSLSEPTSYFLHEEQRVTEAGKVVEKDSLVLVDQQPNCSPAVARKLVHYFGTNLGQIDPMFTGLTEPKFLEDGPLLDQKIALKLAAEASGLAAKANILSVSTKGPHYVKTLHTVLDALVDSDGKAVNAYSLGRDSGAPPADVLKTILSLVDDNILAYENVVDANSSAIVAKRKSILHSWKIAREKEDVQTARTARKWKWWL